MGTCKICGIEAGLFRKVHKECKNRTILYVASIKSGKFHRPTCRYARGEIEEIYSFDDLVAKPYVACKVCKP